MRTLKRTRVFLAWGKYWAFQAYWYPCISFGVHLDFARPLIDIHFLFFIFCIARKGHISGARDRQRQSCRGFLFDTDPIL